MYYRKAITIGILLLVAVSGCQVSMLAPDPQKEAKAEAKKAEADTLERIRTYKIVHEEQQLVRDIMLLRVEVSKLQAANAPQQRPQRPQVKVPELGVEGEFVPLDQLPPEHQ